MMQVRCVMARGAAAVGDGGVVAARRAQTAARDSTPRGKRDTVVVG